MAGRFVVMILECYQHTGKKSNIGSQSGQRDAEPKSGGGGEEKCFKSMYNVHLIYFHAKLMVLHGCEKKTAVNNTTSPALDV